MFFYPPRGVCGELMASGVFQLSEKTLHRRKRKRNDMSELQAWLKHSYLI